MRSSSRGFDRAIHERLDDPRLLLLADVAVRCGSTDPGVFTRSFREDAGMTPSEYRRPAQDAEV